MVKVVQHLWFEKDMEAAIRLDTTLITGSSLDWMSAVPADNPSSPAGSVRTAAFTLGGQSYRALQAGGMPPFNETFSIVIECETQAEIDRLWDALGEGGKIQQCGWLRDRWGLSWQIVPNRLHDLMNDPDPAKAQRATQAMLKMKKLDIAELEAAAAG